MERKQRMDIKRSHITKYIATFKCKNLYGRDDDNFFYKTDIKEWMDG